MTQQERRTAADEQGIAQVVDLMTRRGVFDAFTTLQKEVISKRSGAVRGGEIGEPRLLEDGSVAVPYRWDIYERPLVGKEYKFVEAIVDNQGELAIVGTCRIVLSDSAGSEHTPVSDVVRGIVENSYRVGRDTSKVLGSEA